MTRESDQTVPLYVRTDTADQAHAQYFVSLHFNAVKSPAAAGAVCAFFQRNHYFSEHGARLADYIGAEVGALTEAGYLGGLGRNYAVLREPHAISVLVEPLFLSNPAEAALAARPDYVEQLAQALVMGISRYLARA